jgi:hypothetical protein
LFVFDGRERPAIKVRYIWLRNVIALMGTVERQQARQIGVPCFSTRYANVVERLWYGMENGESLTTALISQADRSISTGKRRG